MGEDWRKRACLKSDCLFVSSYISFTHSYHVNGLSTVALGCRHVGYYLAVLVNTETATWLFTFALFQIVY